MSPSIIGTDTHRVKQLTAPDTRVIVVAVMANFNE